MFLFAFVFPFKHFHVTKSTCSVFFPPTPCVYSIFERLINQLGVSVDLKPGLLSGKGIDNQVNALLFLAPKAL